MRPPTPPRRDPQSSTEPQPLIPPLNADGVPILSIGAEAAASSLGIGPRLLLEKSLSGEIPSLKVGNRRLYSVDALRLYLIENGSMGGEL